jgi:hypothetical protein
MREACLVICAALLAARAARADEPAPAPTVTVAPPEGAAAPLPAPVPALAPPQASDPDVPLRAVPEVIPSRSAARTSEGELVAGEILVGALVMTGLGIPGHYALSYQPTYETIPRSTPASITLNLAGLAALGLAPALAARLVCGIGRWSSDYEGSCGWAIGLAYLGLLAPAVAAAATTGSQPPNCYDCAIPGPSAAAVLTAYILGVTTGAVMGWNLSKHRKDDSLALQPIERAGPPPAALADWSDPAPTSRLSRPLAATLPAIAFAF